ncbi:hypothetical protein LCGC14_2186610 [marine sediment metagenome]|uniref:Uncharacterized protein n=1 Tax=marine sediment metagenome TaxID=412755 RepID=A0A0F9E7X2_9ZZZZ
MSAQQDINEVNQLLAQIRSSAHAACGTGVGIISDTLTSGLSQLGQKMLALQTQVNQLKKENEEYKNKK